MIVYYLFMFKVLVPKKSKNQKLIHSYLIGSIYQARAEREILTNKEDTIRGPSDSIGALKMYILEKRILGT